MGGMLIEPLPKCLTDARGKSLEYFLKDHPHPVIIVPGKMSGGEKAFMTVDGGGYIDEGDTMEISLDALDTPDLPPDSKVHYIAGQESFYNIGRTRNNDIVVLSRKVSKFHAKLVRSPDRITIMDAESTNGTIVDGSKIGSDPVKLDTKAEISLGGVTVFYYTAPEFHVVLRNLDKKYS